MSARQARISRGRILRFQTADITVEPIDGPGPVTAPHHTMSPRTLTRHTTTGIILGFKNTDAVPVDAVAGFSVILWVANPNSYAWFRMTPVSLTSRDASVTYDINAFPLFLQIDAASIAANGLVEFHFMEM